MRFSKRFLLKAIASVALVVLLASTAYAFGYVFLKVTRNQFQTGTVDVSITKITQNDAYIVNLFQSETVHYEPGMTVRGDFVVENHSNDPNGVWYRIYVDNVVGGLKNVMYARIFPYGGTEPLFQGYMSQLDGNRRIMERQLLANEGDAKFTIELYYDQNAGNETQQKTLSFDLGVTATQRKNNDTAAGLLE